MDWITQLLKDAPAAAPYRAQLEELAREHTELRTENARLRDELAWFIPQWETLDGDAVRTLGGATALSTLNDGNGVSISNGLNIPEFTVTARDGTVFNIVLGQATTTSGTPPAVSPVANRLG